MNTDVSTVEGGRLDAVERDGRVRILDHGSLAWKRLAGLVRCGTIVVGRGGDARDVRSGVGGSGALVKDRRGELEEI